MIDNKQNPWTKAAIKRAINAAMECGLIIVGVRPDGTVLTEMPSGLRSLDPDPRRSGPRLRDARELLIDDDELPAFDKPVDRRATSASKPRDARKRLRDEGHDV